MTVPMFVGRVHAPKLKTGDTKYWFYMLQGQSLMRLEYTHLDDATISHEQLTFASNAHSVKSDTLLIAIQEALQAEGSTVSRRPVPIAEVHVPDQTEDIDQTDPIEPLDFPGKSGSTRRF